MPTQSFKSIKTNDVVWHSGTRHVVTGIDFSSNEIKLQLQPVSPRVKTVSYNDVSFNNVVEENKPHKPKRLVAGNVAQQAMQYGFSYAKSHPSGLEGKSIRRPYTVSEVSERIKSLLVDEISKSDSQYVTQSSLNHVVERMASAQGYLISLEQYRPIKSEFRHDYATWQSIASVAVKMSNAYNKMILGKN